MFEEVVQMLEARKRKQAASLSPLGIEREPFVSEHAYFAANPNVAGMMTEDQKVILRSDLQGQARDSVRQNEMARLLMQGYSPRSNLNSSQVAQFRGTPYENDKVNAMRSILARGLSGDPSANMDFSQDSELRRMREVGGGLGGFQPPISLRDTTLEPELFRDTTR
jgi:hypothetical protein